MKKDTTSTEEYERAASIIKTQGILSIAFGGLGVLFSLILMLIFGLAMGESYTEDEAAGNFIMFVLAFVFWLLPHAYLIVSGIILTKLPSAAVASTLSIINIVVSALVNIVLLVFAIMSIIQMNDYDKK